MFLLKNNIFNFFGLRDYNDDLYKDLSGKGLKQRFIELLAQELDETELNRLINFLENVVDSETLLAKYIDLRLEEVGFEIYFGSDEYLRRKILIFIQKIYDFKCTNFAYDLMFRMIGIDGLIEINSYTNESGFDNPNITLDDSFRRFDMSNNFCCIYYTVELTGTIPMSVSLMRAIIAVVLFNEPIFGKLRWIKYNGIQFTTDISGSFSKAFSQSFDS